MGAVARLGAGTTYYASGMFGLATPQIGAHVSLIWPAAGLAFAALVRLRPGMWPAVMLGALPVALSTGLPLWAAVLTALGNAAGPALAAESLRRHGLHTNLDRRQDLWRFGLGAGAATLISATNGTCWLVLSGALPWTLAPAAWASWWLGDLMGVIVVGVPLLTASRATLRRAFGDWRWVPGLLLAGGSVAGLVLVPRPAGRRLAPAVPALSAARLVLPCAAACSPLRPPCCFWR